MWNFIKKQSPARIIASSFALAILIGSILLIMPFSVKEGVKLSYIDSLFTSTSAVCVTGLATVDPGDTFTVVGRIILAVLIQIGGLGLTAIGAGVILMMGKKMNLKSRNLIHEAMNLDTGKGVITFVKEIFITTVIIELIGAILSFIVFVQDYPVNEAIGISLFHAVSAFNNAGFDILGGFQSITGYKDNVLLNLVTSGLIILGGIGFLVIREIWTNKFHWKKYSMHAKVVITVSTFLLLIGTLLIKVTEDVTWIGAFFQSVTARTAGFATYPLATFTKAGLLVMIVLMFIGASSGSTGGGIKTTTAFVLFQGIKSAATNKSERAFKYTIPSNYFRKASVICILGISIIITGTYLMVIMDPNIPVFDALFEMTSAFGTVGLSTGITPTLSIGSKITLMIVMFIGRLGPLTIVSLWHFSRGENIKYPEGNLSIG